MLVSCFRSLKTISIKRFVSIELNVISNAYCLVMASQLGIFYTAIVFKLHAHRLWICPSERKNNLILPI